MTREAAPPSPVVPLLLAAALAALTGCGGEAAAPVTAPAPAIEASVVAPPPPPPVVMDEDVLRKGEGLEAPLGRLGVTPRERVTLVAALDGAADVRRLKAGTGIGLARSAAGAVEQLALRTGPDEVVRVDRAADGYASRTDTLVPETETAALGTIILTSVYQAVVDAGGTPDLVLSFSDVFQWDLDFFADPRVGDHLVLIYETRTRGTLPPATPRWQERDDEEGEPLGPGRILAAAYTGERVEADGYWFDDGNGTKGYYDAEGDSLRKTFLKSPLNYRRISSGFTRARRHPITRKVTSHRAVDYAARPGTPVVASADGRVVSAGYQSILGRHVKIRHGSGRYQTVYGHFSRIAKGIRTGAHVEQNQVIGYVGSTGRATGPHLHFELHDRGTPVNPLTMDNPSTAPVPSESRAAFDDLVRTHRTQLAENTPTRGTLTASE